MKEGQKVWLVKYALTKGISEEVARRVHSDWIYTVSDCWTSHKVGRDVFADYDEAVKAAEALRKKKLDSLRKQIEKLEKLKF